MPRASRPIAIVAPQGERVFQAKIVAIARMLTYTHHHVPNCKSHNGYSTQSMEGWPDESFVRPPRLIVAEIKAERRDAEIYPLQVETLCRLALCGVEAYLWRAGHITEQAIADILQPQSRPLGATPERLRADILETASHLRLRTK